MKRTTCVVELMIGIIVSAVSSVGAAPPEESTRNVTFNKDVLAIVSYDS